MKHLKYISLLVVATFVLLSALTLMETNYFANNISIQERQQMEAATSYEFRNFVWPCSIGVPIIAYVLVIKLN